MFAPRPILPSRRHVRAILCLAVAGAACESSAPEIPTPIPEDTYVDVMSELADLHRFPPPGPGPDARAAAADSARRAVLDRHGVTTEDLLGFAEVAGSDPGRMERITERIVSITDSLAQLRSARDPDAAATGAVATDDGDGAAGIPGGEDGNAAAAAGAAGNATAETERIDRPARREPVPIENRPRRPIGERPDGGRP